MLDKTPNPPRTAMIVDDAFFMRNLLRSILELSGYEVIADAVDGFEAVERYRACRPDLVLMDINMPVRDGIDATRDIIDIDQDACVVICSMLGQEEFIRTAREAGARGFILKPFSEEEVVKVLHKVTAAKFTRKKEVNRRNTETITLM